MKEIFTIHPRRQKVLYQCEHCKTNYKRRQRAMDCEAEPVEDIVFKVGDRVTWTEKRGCTHAYGQDYCIDGLVVAVCGLQLPDEEYNNKWFGGRLAGKHVHMYQVNWECPYCLLKYSRRFYSLELKKL